MIEVSVKKSYNKIQVLDVDFTLEEGKRYAIIGANGSGKTTLLKIMAGVGKPDFGRIIIPEELAFMPQTCVGFSLSVRNNILLPAKLKAIFCGSTRKKLMERASVLMTDLGIDELSRQNGAKLSGGETQKMALARCLILSHSVLLLDEPTSAMDINSATLAEDVIKAYHAEFSPTIIFATHSIKQAERLADEIIYMEGGKILEKGPDILTNPHTPELIRFLKNN